jgi:predicted phosphodiesterase
MRELAVSDMHNNGACVHKLRAQESNDCGVIATLGDIGNRRAVEVLKTLRTFECPIVSARRNWDRKREDVKCGRQGHSFISE